MDTHDPLSLSLSQYPAFFKCSCRILLRPSDAYSTTQRLRVSCERSTMKMPPKSSSDVCPRIL